jgi:dTMP kinase
MFIIIDGIDGSGKGTIIKEWKNYFESQNKKIFDLKEFWLQNNRHPEFSEIKDFDVLSSAEPTYVWTGKAIREEMIKNGNDYSAKSIANAYALDRLVLYKRLIVPFLKLNKTVIQDRSLSTSLCYQPLQDGSITIEEVADIEGNRFALENAPDYLIIADLKAEEAMKRLGDRIGKKDDAIFEKKEFLLKAREVFLSEKFQNYFTQNKTQIKIFNSNQKLDIMKEESIKLLLTLI